MKAYHCSHASNNEKMLYSNDTAIRLADFYKVFGDTTRIRLLSALIGGELCVHDLALMLDMEQSAISHQLRILRNSNLVKSRKDGKLKRYSLDDSHIYEVLTKGLEHIMHINE